MNLAMAPFYIILQIYFITFFAVINGELTDMKIVEEPSNFGLNNAFAHSSPQQEENLKLRVQPANFSGPPHFRRLIGRCFTTVINNYKYMFCPFANITQHEQGVHWNPYQGVLGVWQEWEVSNNTLVAMVMKDGDSCGRIFRSTKITFVCGNHSQILNVSEPHTCSYHLVFLTPLVCHPDSMLVYPTLSPDLQKEWDILEDQMVMGVLTLKGYQKRLDKILEKAGILLSIGVHEQLLKNMDNNDHVKDGQLDTLDKCQEEVRKLKERIANLTRQLRGQTHADPVFAEDMSDRLSDFDLDD